MKKNIMYRSCICIMHPVYEKRNGIQHAYLYCVCVVYTRVGLYYLLELHAKMSHARYFNTRKKNRLRVSISPAS